MTQCYLSHTDGSVNCSYHGNDPPPTKPYLIIILTSLALASLILLIVTALYLLYRRHSKKSSGFVQMDDNHHDNNDNYHDNNAIDDQLPTVQPAQEAGSSRDELQVGRMDLAVPNESSQSECSKLTLEDMYSKRLQSQYHPVTPCISESRKHTSSLVGLQNYNAKLLETVA